MSSKAYLISVKDSLVFLGLKGSHFRTHNVFFHVLYNEFLTFLIHGVDFFLCTIEHRRFQDKLASDAAVVIDISQVTHRNQYLSTNQCTNQM